MQVLFFFAFFKELHRIVISQVIPDKGSQIVFAKVPSVVNCFRVLFIQSSFSLNLSVNTGLVFMQCFFPKLCR